MRIQGFKVLDNPTNGERVKALQRLQARRNVVKLWGMAVGNLPFLHAAYPWVETNMLAALGITAAGVLCVWKIVTHAVDAMMPNGLLWKSGDCIGLVGAGSRDIESRAGRALYEYNEKHFDEPHEVVAFQVAPEHWHEVARIASVPKHRLQALREGHGTPTSA